MKRMLKVVLCLLVASQVFAYNTETLTIGHITDSNGQNANVTITKPLSNDVKMSAMKNSVISKSTSATSTTITFYGYLKFLSVLSTG